MEDEYFQWFLDSNRGIIFFYFKVFKIEK